MKTGDIIEISLSENKRAYGQFVFWDKKMGPLLQVFDLITDSGFDVTRIKNAEFLFPPVITGIHAAVKIGLWKVAGNLPVSGFVYPGFVSTLYDEKTGAAGMWYLWNGKESIRLGYRLPEKYKKLEYLVVWSPYDVVERIETRKTPYPYGDLIHFNKFTPDKGY